MAKFCTSCGSKLEDGKCPNCKEEKTVVETVKSEDVKQSLIECLNVIKGIFVKPKNTIKTYKTENNYLIGLILIVISAISAGLYKIATVKNAYSLNVNSNNGLKQLGNMLLNGNTVKAEPEYFKEFMTTFANNLLEYGLIVVLTYFVVTNILKNKATIKEMISLVGIALSLVIIANLANSILVFIDGDAIVYLRSYISLFSTIFKYLILYEGVNEVSKNKEKLFISTASIFVFTTMIIDILQKIFN